MGPPNATGNLIAGNLIGADASGSTAVGNDVGVWVEDVADNVIGGVTESARNIISGNREGITFLGVGATGNLVLGNYVGTNATGDAAIPNDLGIPIYSPGNTIGGSASGAGNVISGNTINGVNLYGEDAWGNTVEGNLIGTNAAGTGALGNGEHGLAIIFASSNVIGGTDQGAGNVLSGNGIAGVFLLGEDNDSNLVLGNLIGTDITGAAAIGNGESGVAIHSATNNIIGGTDEGSGNVLSGNAFGILLGDLGARGTVIQGNYIGTNATGDAAVPNTEIGVLVWGEDTTIGGSESGAGNVISGNGSAGIGLAENSSGSLIQGNLIGTDATGMTALPNGDGISLNASTDNLIGGTESGAGNVIAGNTGNSIWVGGVGSTGNVIQGNYIGTDVTGTGAIENGGGFWIIDGSNNTIGGTQSGAGNLISGHTGGIRVDGPNASGNVIQGNTLGMDVTGTVPMSVSGAGVRFSNGAFGNTLGGSQPGAGNVIANSGWHGVAIFPEAGNGNTVLSNAIFDNGSLGIEIGRNGVTENDDGDADDGPNGYQNYPTLTSVARNGGAVIQATLNSTPGSTFTLDYFSNDECDPEGFGEGQTPLGTATVATDASGSGTVAASFASISGSVLTATATDADGNTSEFSACSELATLGLSSSPSSQTVAPGGSATYGITLTAQGGTFQDDVDLACSGGPATTTCTLADDQLNLGTGPASTTMTVTTAAPSVLTPVGPSPDGPGDSPNPGVWVLILLMPAVTFLGPGARNGWRGGKRGHGARPGVRWACLTGVMGMLLLMPTACGDGGESPPTGGTAPGTYSLTVTGTWQGAETVATVTLVVQ
jgi:titin